MYVPCFCTDQQWGLELKWARKSRGYELHSQLHREESTCLSTHAEHLKGRGSTATSATRRTPCSYAPCFPKPTSLHQTIVERQCRNDRLVALAALLHQSLAATHTRSIPPHQLTLNSAISSEPFSSLSIILNIFFTRFSGVSSSSGSFTILPTIL